MARIVDGWTEDSKTFYSRFSLPLILNGEMQEQLLDHLAEISKVPVERKPAARSMFLDTLRGLVDKWICSGKSGDGVEDVRKRSIHWKTPASPTPIIESISDYWDRNVPRIKSGDDDRIEIEMRTALPTNPLLRARDMGIYHFLVLLDSSMREELSQCDKCGTYFLRERLPRKDVPIKRGTFCKNCKGSGSQVRTKVSRENERNKLLALAVKFWRQWTERKHPNRALWIAMRMNEKRRATERRITQKWVSRNIDIRTGNVKERSKGNERLQAR